MRKTYFLAGLAAVALTTSCSEDFDLLDNKTNEVTLGVTVSTESTRAAFTYDDTSKKVGFYWNTDDEIGVTSTKNTTQFSLFRLDKGAGTASATFKGNVLGDVDNTCYAVYPYNEGHAMNGTKLTYVFPDTYTYDKVGQTYFPGGASDNSFNPALWAKVSDTSISFKHLGGVFLVMVGKMPCAAGSLEFSAQENMAGKSVVDLNETGTTPESKNGENLTDGTTKVTINFSGAEVDKDGVFYIPVPTGTYTNLRIKILENGTQKVLSNIAAGTFTIARRYLYRLTLNGAVLSATETTQVSTAADAQAALEKDNNVAVAAIKAAAGASSESPTTATVTVPEVAATSSSSEETEPTTKTIAVEEITENVKIELTDAGKDSKEEDQTKNDKQSVENVTLSIPNITVTEENKEKLPAVDVNMPKSTVTLAGNAGVANFGTVTAETAENTLVVRSGVTIQKLIVKKGNVRIESGAKVVAIEKDGSNTGTPIIYYEDANSLPATTSDFTLVKAVLIDTESDFADAMSKGGTDCMLTKNLTLSRAYATNKTVSFDLNGKTLNAKALGAKTNGTLTLKNGKLVQDKTTMTIESGSPLTKSANEYIVGGHDFVDLGLSVLWATMNLGASSETEYGEYYAWGETTTKTTYTWNTYTNKGETTDTYTKYNAAATLAAADDAATAKWGTNCRIPTKAEFEELDALRRSVYGTDWYTVSNVNGYKFVGTTGKTVFLPAAGDASSISAANTDDDYRGIFGIYWASTCDSNGKVDSFWLQKAGCNMANYLDRYYGLSVRPVAAKPE